MSIENKKNSSFMKNLEEKGVKIKLKHRYGRRGGALHVHPTKDPYNGQYLGFEKLSMREKEDVPWFIDEKSSMKIFHDKELDLSDKYTLAIWRMIKFSPEIAFSLAEAKSTNALYYVFAEDEAVKKSVITKKAKHDARTLIFDDDVSNLKMRARLLGYDMSSDKTDVVLDFLLDIADHSPNKIREAYSNSLNSLKILFYKGLDSGKITQDGNLYMYGGFNLGVTEDACIEFMNKSTSLEMVEKMRDHIESVLVMPDTVTDSNKEKEVIIKEDIKLEETEVAKEGDSKPPYKMSTEELDNYILLNDVEFSGNLEDISFKDKKKLAQDHFKENE